MNAACRLADRCALNENIADTLNAVIFHAHQVIRAELGMSCSCIEESWGGVDEVSLRHIGVCLNCVFNVVAVNADSDAHEHALRPFSNLAFETKERRAFEGLEAEELVVETELVDDDGVESGECKVAVQTAASGLARTCPRDLRPTIAQPQPRLSARYGRKM